MKNTLSLPANSPLRLILWSETARFSVLMMELLWLANWYDLLVQPATSSAVVVVSLGSVLMVTHLLARGMNYRKIQLSWRRVIFTAWLLLVLLLSLNDLVYTGLNLSLGELIMRPVNSIGSLKDDLREFWHILMILVLVWRGVALAREPVGILSAQFSFQLGLVMMLFYGIGMGFVKPLYAILTLYAFLFFGLLAMSAARIYSIGDLRGGKLPVPGRKWAFGIVLAALVIVGSAVFAGWASSTWAADIVLQGYLILFSLLIVIGLILLSPLIALIFWFSPGLRDLLSELMKGSLLSGLMEFLNSAADAVQNPPEWVVTGLQVGKPLVFGGIILVIVVGLLFFLVWKPWQQLPRREDGASDLPFHPIFALPKFIFNRLGSRLVNSRRMIAAARVRWIYAQLMALCAGLGQPRPQAVTPIEFLPRLVRLFPEQTAELNQITQAYLKVRYGMYPETQAEVTEVEECWGRVRRVGHSLVKIYKQASEERRKIIPKNAPAW